MFTQTLDIDENFVNVNRYNFRPVKYLLKFQ